VEYYRDLDEIRENWLIGQQFAPMLTAEEVQKKLCGWKKAVSCCLGWAKDL